MKNKSTRIRYNKVNDVSYVSRETYEVRGSKYQAAIQTDIMSYTVTKDGTPIILAPADTINLLKIGVKKALQDLGVVFKSESRKTTPKDKGIKHSETPDSTVV